MADPRTPGTSDPAKDGVDSTSRGEQSTGGSGYEEQNYPAGPNHGADQNYPAPNYPAEGHSAGQNYSAAPQYPTQPYGWQQTGSQQFSAQPQYGPPYAGQSGGAGQFGAQRHSAYPAGAEGVPPCPSPRVGWAVAAMAFFFPLAFVAFIRAFEVYPLWMQGRYAEAEAASRTVALLGKIALGIFIVYIVFFVLYLFLLTFAVVDSMNY